MKLKNSLEIRPQIGRTISGAPPIRHTVRAPIGVARDRGFARYFSFAKCHRGHASDRDTWSGSCRDCENIKAVRYDDQRKAALERKAQRDAIAGPFIPWPYYLPAWQQQLIATENAAAKADRARKNAEEARARRMHRYANDPLYSLTHRIRCLVSGAFHRRGRDKPTRTEIILGCSFAEFARHIELQFLPGMTWENRRLWDVDHIVPASTACTEADVFALNHFTNLRPLWSGDNRSKGAKVTHLL